MRRIESLHRTLSAVPLRSGESFIHQASNDGAASLLGAFLTSGQRFDRVLDGMRITSLSPGRVETELIVNEGLQNAFGTLHGGASCTLIDVVGTLALLTLDHTRPGVSVELNSSFLSAAKAGELVKCVGVVLKTGKKLGFTQVEVLGGDGRRIAIGRHIKAL